MKRRHLGHMFLFTLITLGIYQFFWLIYTRQEIIHTTPKAQIPSGWWLVSPLLIILLTTILSAIFESDTQSDFGIALVIITVGSILSMFIIVPYWLYNYAKAVALMTKNTYSTPFVFWMAILCQGVAWSLMMQHAYNALATEKKDATT